MLADGTVNGRHEGIRNGQFSRTPLPPHEYTRINDEDIDRIELIESGKCQVGMLCGNYSNHIW